MVASKQADSTLKPFSSHVSEKAAPIEAEKTTAVSGSERDVSALDTKYSNDVTSKSTTAIAPPSSHSEKTQAISDPASSPPQPNIQEEHSNVSPHEENDIPTRRSLSIDLGAPTASAVVTIGTPPITEDAAHGLSAASKVHEAEAEGEAVVKQAAAVSTARIPATSETAAVQSNDGISSSSSRAAADRPSSSKVTQGESLSKSREEARTNASVGEEKGLFRRVRDSVRRKGSKRVG